MSTNENIQQPDVSISNDFLFESDEEAQRVETVEEVSNDTEYTELTDGVNIEEALAGYRNPEEYFKGIVENFNDEKKSELLDKVNNYISFTKEYKEKVTEFFTSNPNPKDDNDLTSLKVDPSDERYAGLWNEVMPIINVLIDNNKVDASVLEDIKSANQTLGRYSLIVNSFVLFNEEELEMVTQQLDTGVLQNVFRMTEYQLTNVLRTLNVLRSEGNLKLAEINNILEITKNIHDRTTNYLKFLEIDSSIITEVYNVVAELAEGYKQYAVE